jgi:RimJ/RimL family protein N-acetyltransferase
MSQPFLFCKPLPGMHPTELLFLVKDKELSGTISFRSLCLTTDIDTIHDWVNQPYSRRYWQMNVDKASLSDSYTSLLNSPEAHSFIGLFNNKIVCQIDCYLVAADELKDHVEVSPGNCGLHILMLPPRESQKGLTESMLRAFIKFYFSFSAATTLYGEPDHRNTAANLAAKRTGFEFQKQITLSYKTANLYSITKQQFHATYPIL